MPCSWVCTSHTIPVFRHGTSSLRTQGGVAGGGGAALTPADLAAQVAHRTPAQGFRKPLPPCPRRKVWGTACPGTRWASTGDTAGTSARSAIAAVGWGAPSGSHGRPSQFTASPSLSFKVRRAQCCHIVLVHSMHFVVVRAGLLMCASFFCCARACLCFSALPRAVLLLCASFFAVRGAACFSARCLVRCCCCARGVLLRAGLLVFQRVASCGAAAVSEVFCCARGCLFFSALPRAVLLLCARCFATRGAACIAACGAATLREVFCCARSCLFF
jgi:hypothetical protein